MFRLFVNLTRRYTTGHRLRILLTVLGIALGVAALVSIRMVNRTILASFQKTISAIAGQASLQVIARGQGFAEDLLERIEPLESIAEARPVVPGFLSTVEERPERLLILGLDFVKDGIGDSSSSFGSSLAEGDPLTFIANGDSIALSETFAEKLSLSLGSEIRLMTVKGVKSYFVRALMGRSEQSSIYGGRVGLMDLPVAQNAFGKAGKLSQIDLVLEQGYDAGTVRENLRGLLPDSVDVVRPKQRGRQIDAISSSFRIGLSFVSLLTLVVALFLVYNTAQVSVVERHREIGILRALGLLRREVMALFLLDALWIGVVASIVGVGVGFLMAKASLSFVGETVDSLFFKADLAGLRVSSTDLLVGGTAGVLTTLAGSFVPALRACLLSPSKVLMAHGLGGRPGTALSFMPLVTGCLLAALGAAIWLGMPESLPGSVRFTAGMVATLLVLLGISLSSAHLLQATGRLLTPLLERAVPVLSRVAFEGATNNPERSGIAITTLLLSLATILTIAVLVSSLRYSLQTWVEQVVTADLVITSSSRIAGPLSTPLAGNLGETLSRIPGVRLVDRYRSVHSSYMGKPVLLSSWDSSVAAKTRRLIMVEGSGKEAFLALARGSILISESFRERFRLHRGDRLTLETERGRTTFDVAGVFVDYTSDIGTVLLDRKRYQLLWDDSLVDAYDLWLEAGAEPESVAEQIRRRLNPTHQLFVSTHSQIRRRVLRLMQESFRVNYALEVVAISVAILGLVQSLLSSAVDRKREFGVLRALGVTRDELRLSLTLEGGLLGFTGSILAAIGGAVISFYHVVHNTKALTGWTLDYQFAWTWCWGIVVGSVLLSGLAGALVGSCVSKERISEVIRYE